MADSLTATGLSVDDLQTRIDDIKGEFWNRISPTMNLEDETPESELIGIFAEREQAIMELIQEVYAGSYPDTAGGFQLTMVSTFTGTTRRDATKTLVLCSVNLSLGSYPAGTLIGYIDGNPDQRFSNVNSVTQPLIVGTINNVIFESETTGVIPAYANTLDNIAEPVVGFNSINNPADHYYLGTEEETDPALRQRRETEVAQGGSTSSNAIAANVSEIEGVVFVKVLENETDYVDSNGLPSHSIAVSIYAPTVTDAVIAAAIYDAKASGVNTYGSSNAVVTDDQGFSHNVNFTKVTVITVYVDVTIETDDTYEGDTALKADLADYCDEYFGVGEDFIWAKVLARVSNFQGVTDVTLLELDDVSPPVATSNLAISWDELGNLDTANISITVV